MKLFILAAGKGERLWPLTKNTPKSLIDFGNGTTLLERQITNAIDSGLFDEVIIVTGYKAEQIDAKIRDYNDGIELTTIYNPFYDSANNLVSLWTAHYKMFDHDFMITNGDNVYMTDVFQKVQTDKQDTIQITISHKEHYDDDDMKVSLDSDGNVLKINKEIPKEQTDAESVGLTLVKGEKSRRLFVNKILQLVTIKRYLHEFWLEIFNSLIEDGITVQIARIEKKEWREVDFHPDVDSIKKMVINGLKFC